VITLSNQKRASGILLHITSLPSAFGTGDLGPESYNFVDLLSGIKQHYWSILPLSPTRLEDGNSPYHTSSALAGNPLLISPEKLSEDGLLKEVPEVKLGYSTKRIAFKEVYKQKEAILAQVLAQRPQDNCEAFETFCEKNQEWLNDYALYFVLRCFSGKPWNLWETSVRKREKESIKRKTDTFKPQIDEVKFKQFLFFSQWQSLKEYCKRKQINIVGDIPFYVAFDSVDVWLHPELFILNKSGVPKFVSGVPPDYFSATGQLWGNPVYNWSKMAETGFEWWIDRIRHALNMYDKIRLDHFRGFIAYWQVPAKETTAQFGKWVNAKPDAFFDKIKTAFPMLPFIAEDLGYIDEPVRQAITRLGIPGMRVLLFGFNGSNNNPHLVKNHPECSVVYTGTHDTNTVKGWFIEEATSKEKSQLFKVVGKKITSKEVSYHLLRLALTSAAKLSIIPLQDVLSLDSDARMNNPKKSKDNWEWRVTNRQLSSNSLQLLSEWTTKFNRE
jgi:4-alpha-glucanotransferase